MCVYLIGLHKIHGKVKKADLLLKYVTMIDPVMSWFKIIQYKDKKVMTIVTLIKTTWMTRYPWPMEIMFEQGLYFIGHKFKNSLIQE